MLLGGFGKARAVPGSQGFLVQRAHGRSGRLVAEVGAVQAYRPQLGRRLDRREFHQRSAAPRDDDLLAGQRAFDELGEVRFCLTFIAPPQLSSGLCRPMLPPEVLPVDWPRRLPVIRGLGRQTKPG